ncbi:MAG: T9SS type A sorting domain-containing protein [Crocinitomicaceae bacterium]|nr:T9SS type A sorting domain-containing protein [Crocinitomicaceae bacterium]
MKRVSVFLCTLILGFGVKAQVLNSPANEIPAAPRRVSSADLAAPTNHPAAQAQVRTGFFSEDFANGFSGNNDFGAWTYEDSGNNTIWMMANANSPAGQYSAPSQAPNSPTKANGWVIFDADFYNTPASSGVEDVHGWLQAPALDCSALSSVIVEYYQTFRYCCYSVSPLTLEVSTDNGTTWVVYPAHGNFIESANALSANPLLTKVDISCAAAGESNVLVRWGFNLSEHEGYSHYFWGIDDISIYENTVADDLEIVQLTNGDIYNVWEYLVTPFEQRIPAADGGVLAGVICRNNGFNDQPNTVITVEVLDADDNVLTTIVSDPFMLEAFANTPECPSIMLDTLWIETGWEPATVDTFMLRATISTGGVEENMTNNVQERMMIYSIDEYGHDDFGELDIEISPRENEDNTEEFEPTGYGNFFHIPNTGSTAYGTSVVFGPNCSVGVTFSAILYKGSPNDGDVQSSEDYFTTEGQLNELPQYYAFDDPIQLLAGEKYFCGIINEEYTTEELTVLAQSHSDTDNSTGVYQKGGSGEFSWFVSQTWTPAVRMILSNRVGMDEMTIGLQSFNIYPNPAVDVVKVEFTLNAASSVAYEVRDMSGRLIETKSNIGRFMPGTNTFDLNVSKYSAGNYTFSLVIDGAYLFSRQLSVIK